MGTNTIITLGRQYGSGGREIGKLVAQKLQIDYYDKEILKEAAKNSGMCEAIFENFDEKPTTSFLYSLVMDPYSLGYNSAAFDMPLNHKVFLAAYETIKKTADKGPCVIVGRCADYALADYKNCFNIFIDAPLEDRAIRTADRLNITVDKAKDIANKEDKQRASYYNYYTTKKWGHVKSYDICINSSLFGIEGTADVICDIVKKLENK